MAVVGASEIATQGERYGAAVEQVAAAHSLRIMPVVAVIPFALKYLNVHGMDPYVPAARAVAGSRFWFGAIVGERHASSHRDFGDFARRYCRDEPDGQNPATWRGGGVDVSCRTHGGAGADECTVVPPAEKTGLTLLLQTYYRFIAAARTRQRRGFLSRGPKARVDRSWRYRRPVALAARRPLHSRD